MTSIIEIISKKFNIFKIVQFIWLLELYFLGLNAIKNFVMSFNIKFNFGGTIILKYNSVALNYFKEYASIVGFISISLIIVGGLNATIKEVNILKDYKFMVNYCDIGIYLGGWLLMIYATYKVYQINYLLVICIFPIIVGLKFGANKIIELYKNSKFY